MNRIILLLFTVFFAAACSNYGKKIKEGHIEVFYEDGITERQAEKTVRTLYDADTKGGNEPVRKSFQLLREGDAIVLKMVVDEKRAKGMSDEAFSPIAALVSEKAFESKPVEMELTDKKFKTIRTIANKNPEENRDEINIKAFGEKISEGNSEVYFRGAGKEEASLLATFMNEYFKPGTIFSFQLIKDEAENYTVKMVGNPDKINTLPVSLFEELCRGICDKVLSVPSVKFEMTDAKFNALRTYNYPADTGDPDRNN